MKCNYLIAIAITAMAFSATSIAATPNIEVINALKAKRPHIANQLLIQYKTSATLSQQTSFMKRYRATLVRKVLDKQLRRDSRGDMTLITLPKTLALTTAITNLSADPSVEFVEPNWIYKHTAISNDPYVVNGSLWGMTSVNGSRASVAWGNNKTNCSTVWIGVIDEGYMYTHTDLRNNVGKNPREIAGNNLDDDGNGYIDDVYGWDFANNDKTVFDGITDDHGTHVAGTIGGVGGNKIGVAGVCWKIKLLNAKFLGTTGGTTANAIKAIDYFTDMKVRHGLNLVATNNSWGGGGFSQALQDAITRAHQADILFIAAAGNSAFNCDTASPCYPAEYPNSNIISVASIQKNGNLSGFSNYGLTSIDICAPGSGIFSTVPVRNQQNNIISGYANYSGTSMAAPHVTGAAALYAAYHPGASAALIKGEILAKATATVSCNGKTLTGGRLNVSTF